MAQQDYRIIERYSNEHQPNEFVFFDQNKENFRTCTKHKDKELYYIISPDGKYALYVTNKERASDILHYTGNIDLGGLLETDAQEEIEKITSENIEEKSKEILERFNTNFKLNVDYNPRDSDLEIIQDRIKKTQWNKENKFLLNFYLMEIVKRKINAKWIFEKVETFNPFYFPEYSQTLVAETPDGQIQTMSSGNNFYSYLEKKKFFDLKYIIRMSLQREEFNEKLTKSLFKFFSVIILWQIISRCFQQIP